jgi:prevent-host-death family protein
MRSMSATEASGGFSDLLEAVEHEGESVRIVRHGRTVALVIPAPPARGADVIALLGRHRTDPAWAEEVRALRDLVDEA